jgi:hypothetical protein
MVKMKDPKFFDKAFNKIIKYYIDLNKNVFKDIFFAKILEENGDNIFITNSFNQGIQPILIGQMGVLYKLCPFKYSGMINDDFLNFISMNFKNNVVFLTTDDGFLVYIMLMQTTSSERTMVNEYFAKNIDELNRYQYFSSEYDPFFEKYKLLTARTHTNDDTVKDIILTFS